MLDGQGCRACTERIQALVDAMLKPHGGDVLLV